MLAFIRRNWWLGLLLGLVAGFALGTMWRSLMLNRGYDAAWDTNLYLNIGVEMGGAIIVVGLILLALELIHRRLNHIATLLETISQASPNKD